MAAGPRRVGRRDLLGASALGITSTLLPPATTAASNGGLAGAGAADELDPDTATVVSVTEDAASPTEGVRGIATDGDSVYWRRNLSSTIREVGMDGTFVADHDVAGLPDFYEGNDLAMSGGHLFTRGASSGDGPSTLTAVSSTSWTARAVTLPEAHPLPAPTRGFMHGNLADLPDGRLAAVSAPVAQDDGSYVSTLRTWTVDTTGGTSDPIVLTHSRDYLLEDSEDWPNDCHGIASDGVHLYRLRYLGGYRVWTLAATGRSGLAFDADCTSGCTGTATFRDIDPAGGSWNATYMARDHVAGRYVVGNYSGGANGQFYLTG